MQLSALCTIYARTNIAADTKCIYEIQCWITNTYIEQAALHVRVAQLANGAHELAKVSVRCVSCCICVAIAVSIYI